MTSSGSQHAQMSAVTRESDVCTSERNISTNRRATGRWFSFCSGAGRMGVTSPSITLLEVQPQMESEMEQLRNASIKFGAVYALVEFS
jgi:hypothetical protein